MIHSNNSISQLGRRFGGALLSLLLCCTMQAQEQIRIWQGGNTSSSRFTTSELLFSEDGTNLSINDTTFQTSEIDSIMVVHTVTVTYNGAQATVDLGHAPGVTYTTDGAHVNIVSTNTKDELEFVLQGESTQGSLTYTGSFKCKFYLNGLKLTSDKGGVIDIQCGKRVDLILNDSTENILVDAPNGQQKAALYCKGHVELSGGGSLTVTGNTKHGIATNEYLELKKSAGSITVNGAVSDAMHIGQYFLMNGGFVELSGQKGDGLQVETDSVSISDTKEKVEDTTKVNNGMMFLNSGELRIQTTEDCTESIKVSKNLTITGGTIRINSTGDGCKGISVTGNVLINKDTSYPLIQVSYSGDTYVYDDDSEEKCCGIRIKGNFTVNSGRVSVLHHTNNRAEYYDIRLNKNSVYSINDAENGGDAILTGSISRTKK